MTAPSTSSPQTIAIVGAGLTGLTTAFYLLRAGHEVMVFEQAPRVGGQIASFEREGFVYESGPNTGVISHPEVAELLDDLGGDLLRTARPEAKARWIWQANGFRALPSSLRTAIATPLFSWRDKLRILGEPFRRRGTDPNESIAALARRRLGATFVRNAIDPFISGVYAGDPAQLVTRFALPRLYALEQNHGSFVRGALAKMRQPRSDRDRRATKEVWTTVGGLERLIEALAAQIGDQRIITSVGELQIRPAAGEKGWQLAFNHDGQPRLLHADQVVTTCPAYALPGLLPFVASDELAPFTALRYAPVVQAAVAVSHLRGQELAAFGGLVPSAEGERVLGILFPSSCFAHRAPEGGALLSVFMGGMRHPDLVAMPDAELRAIVEDAVERMLGVDRRDIAFVEIFRHPRAIPQYEASTEQRLALIDRLQTQHAGLTIGGNLRDGIGMADRIKQARHIAATLC